MTTIDIMFREFIIELLLIVFLSLTVPILILIELLMLLIMIAAQIVTVLSRFLN